MENIPDPTFLKCFQNHKLSINWIAFSPNSSYLASVSDDNNVMLWTVNDRSNTCYKYIGHKDSVNSIALANTFMVSGSKDCTARLWRIDQREIVENNISSESIVYRCHKSPINCIDLNFDNSQFCTASDDQTVKIWSCSCANKLISSLNGEHSNWVRHARFSKLNPNLLSSCADDGTICIWDIRSKDAAIKLSSKRRSTHFLSVQWHPTCEYIMSSSSSDCLVRIWDLRYEKTIQFYQVHNGIVSSSDFHSSGNYLISSSIDQTCKIIDLFEGRTLFTLRAHTGPVNCATFNSTGEYFATAGQDHVVLLWQSNLPTSNYDNDDKNSEDEDDIRSITYDPNAHCTNIFNDSEKVVESMKKNRLNSQTVSNKKSTISNETSSRMDYCSIDNDLNDNFNHTGQSKNTIGDNLKLENSMSVLKCILQQLDTITDSILQIDQRLTNLEDKFKLINKNNYS